MLSREFKADITMDFNSPESVERELAKLAQLMIDDDNEAVQKAGLWLKNEAIGFTAALADFQRHDYSPLDCVNALVNAFAHLLTFATLSLNCANQAELKKAANAILSGIATPYINMLQKNAKALSTND